MSSNEFSIEKIQKTGEELNDINLPLKTRFRALFTLKNIGGPEAVKYISKSFEDKSDLLKHELAYCLGQMQDTSAIEILEKVLKNKSQHPMVRHEAAEALGAIGEPSSLKILEEYSKDSSIEVAETCHIAIDRIKWLIDNKFNIEKNSSYTSVDPSPSHSSKNIQQLRDILLNESLELFERYKAMFALRNNGSIEAIKALASGFQCKSALFRHEIGFVFGQMQSTDSIDFLKTVVANTNESPMVRHECAEALGSIATDDCLKFLEKYLNDSEDVVRESCEVALDIGSYQRSDEFQYADRLVA